MTDHPSAVCSQGSGCGHCRQDRPESAGRGAQIRNMTAFLAADFSRKRCRIELNHGIQDTPVRFDTIAVIGIMTQVRTGDDQGVFPPDGLCQFFSELLAHVDIRPTDNDWNNFSFGEHLLDERQDNLCRMLPAMHPSIGRYGLAG